MEVKAYGWLEAAVQALNPSAQEAERGRLTTAAKVTLLYIVSSKTAMATR